MTVTLDAVTRSRLDERRLATIATISEDGTPHLTVMGYLRWGDTIVFYTESARRKERNLRRDQRVALWSRTATATSR